MNRRVDTRAAYARRMLTLALAASVVAVGMIVGAGLPATAATTDYASTGPVTIPDNNPTGAVSPVTVPSGLGSLGKLTVTIDSITHPWDGDLSISLISPASLGSVSVPLVTRIGTVPPHTACCGYSGDNFTATKFDDASGSGTLNQFTSGAAATAQFGSGPVTGTWNPKSPLSVFGGADPAGVWQLKVVDGEAGDAGTINAWHLSVTPAPAVTALSPTAGTTAGGTSVVITGTDFTGATAVTFGGDAATSYTVDSDAQITAMSPAHAAGSVQVQVTTPAGASANTVADDYLFTTPPPTGGKAQTPADSCVTAGTASTLPRHGSAKLMAPGCVTNAGQKVGVSVRARLRGDLRFYSLYCQVSKSKTRTTTATGYGDGSRYCRVGTMKIRTYGSKLRIQVTWGAPATGDYAVYKKVKAYKA